VTSVTITPDIRTVRLGSLAVGDGFMDDDGQTYIMLNQRGKEEGTMLCIDTSMFSIHTFPFTTMVKPFARMEIKFYWE
jgi:hypothetical protein